MASTRDAHATRSRTSSGTVSGPVVIAGPSSRRRSTRRVDLERTPIPVAELGGRLVGGLEELQQCRVGVWGRAHRLIGEQELVELVAVERIGRGDRVAAETVWDRIGIGVEGAFLAGAGPEPRAAHLV